MFGGWICKSREVNSGFRNVFRTIVKQKSFSCSVWASLGAQTVKNLPTTQKTQVQFVGQEDPLEKEMATHSSILS